MSRREDVDNAIWNDPEYAGLSPHGKLLYLWSFTNPHCNMSGLYKLRRQVIGFETGLTDDEATAALAELERGRLLFYDGDVMFVRARVKHLRTRGGNMAKSIAADVLKIRQDHPMRVAFLREYTAEQRGLQWIKDVLIALRHGESETPSGTLPDPPQNPLEGSRARAGARAGQGRDTTTARRARGGQSNTPGGPDALVPWLVDRGLPESWALQAWQLQRLGQLDEEKLRRKVEADAAEANAA